jgi:hypothetical protein
MPAGVPTQPVIWNMTRLAPTFKELARIGVLKKESFIYLKISFRFLGPAESVGQGLTLVACYSYNSC